MERKDERTEGNALCSFVEAKPLVVSSGLDRLCESLQKKETAYV
jgi:hypothetical protein